MVLLGFTFGSPSRGVGADSAFHAVHGQHDEPVAVGHLRAPPFRAPDPDHARKLLDGACRPSESSTRTLSGRKLVPKTRCRGDSVRQGPGSARLRRAGLRCFEGLGGSTRRRRYTAPQRKQGENAVNRGALYHSFPVVAARLVHDPPASILPRWWARWGRRARRPPCYVPYGGSVARSDANRSKGLSPNALERRPGHHLGASAVGLCSGA